MTRAFLAPDSPLGWTMPDYLSIVIVAITAGLFWKCRFVATTWFQLLAAKPPVAMVIVFALPIALRSLFLPHHPAPVPSGADDFGYLLTADTLRHLRLANPPNFLPDFFQQIFVLQQPSYASMFPLGQGFVLLAGWTGVLMSAGVFCAGLYWMLRGWTTPGWALAGGLLAGLQFGATCYWMNCYWGGYVSAFAGCLVFGAAARKTRHAAALIGIGLGLQALTRQYEFLLLLAVVLIFFWRRLRVVTVLCFLPAVALIVLQNKAVTGHWSELPYFAYRYQYGIPAAFTWQPNPVPHAQLNPEQELDYQTECAVHGEGPETLGRFASRLLLRVRFYRFFLYAPLYIAFGWFVIRVRLKWLIGALAIFVLATNFYPYFYPHYIAAVTCLFVLGAVLGLQRMKPSLALAILIASLCEFGYSFVTHKGSWDFLNGTDPQGRTTIARQLAAAPGRQIVFVLYAPTHGLSEWVHNDADIAASRIIYAHDLGATANAELLAHYPGRAAWLLKPDETPPVLIPYPKQTSVFEDVQ